MESTPAADRERKRKHGNTGFNGELDDESSSSSKRIPKFKEESVQDETPESGVSTTEDDGADEESLAVLRTPISEEVAETDDDDELAETGDSSKRTPISEEGIFKDEDKELAESSCSSGSTLQHQEDKSKEGGSGKHQETDNITTEAECGFFVHSGNDDENVMMGSATRSAAIDESTSLGVHSSDRSRKDEVNLNKFCELIRNPEGEHKACVLDVVYEGEILIVQDAIPKSDLHVLIIPTKQNLRFLCHVKPCDIPLLRRMKYEGIKIAQAYLKNKPYQAVRLGFHGRQTMAQVHMHVLSQDFVKTPDAWVYNKNNTEFFKDVDTTINELIKHGKVLVPSNKKRKSLLKSKLRCNRCGADYDSLKLVLDHQKQCPFPKSMMNGSLILGEKCDIVDD